MIKHLLPSFYLTGNRPPSNAQTDRLVNVMEILAKFDFGQATSLRML